MDRIDPSFFTRDPVVCARELIGCVFEWDGCRARIVETEAYSSEGDPACHLFNRPSAREFAAAHPPGTAYVYLNYGVHWLFNILVKSRDVSGFVLLRALEPIAGVELMASRRPARRLDHLCAGPGCLTQALGIDGESHGEQFLCHDGRGLERESVNFRPVASCPRIGISRAVGLRWRFAEKESRFLSRKIPDS